MKTEPKKERLKEIDMLRGIAMFVMILIHTNAYFLSNKAAKLLWDLSQFAVPVFIFCSSYLYFYKNLVFNSFSEIVMYVKKRFARLLQPYYIFAGVFIGVLALKDIKNVSLQYILNTFFIIGGIDINWLVLLFLVFSFIMPFLSYGLKKNRSLFYFFSLCAFVSSVFFIFYRFPFNYRYIMWLPWSTMIIVGHFVFQNEKKKWFFPALALGSFVVFVVFRLIQQSLNHSLIMYDNKYPPNIFHLSYGIFALVVVRWLVNTKVFQTRLIHSFFSFLSKYSYSLYFIHYTILFILMLFFKFKFTWWSFFGVVLLLSLMIRSILNAIHRLIKISIYPIREYSQSDIKEFLALDTKETKELRKKGLV